MHDDNKDSVGREIPDKAPKVSQLLQLWILRLLVRLNGYREFIRAADFSDDDLAIALGFRRLVRLESTMDRKAIADTLRVQHEVAEAKAATARPPAVLRRNVKRLAQMLGMSAEECRVLEFAVIVANEEMLENACNWLGHSLTTTRALRAIASIVDLPRRRVADILSPQGLLSRSGLLTINRNGSGSLRGKLDLLSDTFADRMLSCDAEPIEQLRGMVVLAPGPQLELSDYDHLGSSLSLLRSYVRVARADGRRGVNIFLHGPPGTGKTQLARRLAQDLNSDLFEVSSEDESGDPVSGERRLRAFRAAQTLLAKRSSLILFDEVEDVFNDGSELFGRKSTAQTRKAWMNRMLEDSPVPTFWLSNSIASVDPAFIRRFDMVIELPIPPRSQRQRIIERTCGDLVGADCVARISASDCLAPAVISRAASVVRALGKSVDCVSAEDSLVQLIDNTLEAQGHRRLVRNDPTQLPDSYDPGMLNADADIPALAHGLQSSRAGRLCLYGPPGTGKTAFGRWLAQQLDVPLQVRRASDLLSPYVGMTERNFARAFREAEQDNALLMIDEVDTFLRDRTTAQRSWEVSQVNEMLTQMEAFAGVFIASTNLMEGLDPAALRRFDVKVRLGYLKPAQATAMLRACCLELRLDPPSEADEEAVAKFDRLAAGDFATLMRQNRFRPIGRASQLVGLLGAEVGLKGSRTRPIGFLQ